MSDTQMAIFSELPDDMLVEISKRMKKAKRLCLISSVSRSLYAAVTNEHFEGLRLLQGLPYLLLPVKDDDDDVRELYSLAEGEITVASLNVPNFKNMKCYESLGWLLAVKGDGNVALLDPFTGVEILLPPQNTLDKEESDEYVFFQKILLSARPSETQNFIVMVIYGGYRNLAFWWPGDKAWNRIEFQGGGPVCDMVYDDDGKFYSIGNAGQVFVFRLVKDGDDYNVRIEYLVDCRHVVPYYPSPAFHSMNMYILKSDDDSVLIITRKAPLLSEDHSSYITSEIRVFKVDILNQSCEEINSSGGMAVFVGHNSTIAVDPSRFQGRGIKANHVYFTDDDWRQYYLWSSSPEGGGLDMGVCNLETGIIEPFYQGEPMRSKISTSLWITPS